MITIILLVFWVFLLISIKYSCVHESFIFYQLHLQVQPLLLVFLQLNH